MTAVFDRLIGLETEYAIHYRAEQPESRPSNYELYSGLVKALQRKLPTADTDPAAVGKPGIYLANGGAVWFDCPRSAIQSGVVEGSTPECRSPRQLLICQRAQDRLLSETARHAGPGFRLVKGCRDSQGETYGAQENYSILLGSGWRLRIWCAAWIVLSTVLAVQCLLLVVFWIIVLLCYLALAGLLYLLLRTILRPSAARQEQWRTWLFGPKAEHPSSLAGLPVWLEVSCQATEKLLVAPLFVLVSWLVAVTDMRRTQQRLLPFLASRAVIGGSGWLGPDGRFHLTEKAETRNALWTILLPNHTRPVFEVSHFLKMAGPIRPRWTELMAPRQRLQLCLGDSNLCQEAEYLRVATTLLVLDAIEAGAITSPPQLRQPLQAIHQISGDPTLTATIELAGGGSLTALELQRWYLDACRRFVESVSDAPEEAREVLRLWADVLDKLATDRSALVGRLDWVTKQLLLEEAAHLPYPARKKIDLRYHELSPEGYFTVLEQAGLTRAVVSEGEIEQAMRLPPISSPAWKRARYIREFSGGGLLAVGWRFLTIRGQDGTKTTIDLHDAARE